MLETEPGVPGQQFGKFPEASFNVLSSSHENEGVTTRSVPALVEIPDYSYRLLYIVRAWFLEIRDLYWVCTSLDAKDDCFVGLVIGVEEFQEM